MADPMGFPPPPDPVKVARWAGQIRLLVGLLAGAGLIGGAWAGVSAEQIGNWLTAGLTLTSIIGAAWASFSSWRAKQADRKALVAAAVASAQHGVPVVVAVTPPGVPNVAVSISPAEQVAAPAVPVNVPPLPAA